MTGRAQLDALTERYLHFKELWRCCIIIDVTGVWDISHRLRLKKR